MAAHLQHNDISSFLGSFGAHVRNMAQDFRGIFHSSTRRFPQGLAVAILRGSLTERDEHLAGIH